MTAFHDIRFRRVTPNDWHRLQLFFRRLSPETVELRFHGAKRELSAMEAHHFAELDGKNDVGLVATTGTRGRIVGLGGYSRISPTCAEVAMVIEDAYQHHGVGRRMMRRLRMIALQNGMTGFVGEILPGNEPALRLMRENGDAAIHSYGNEIQVSVDLTSAA
jgi:GNAT superfamily N-acetyltransferase